MTLLTVVLQGTDKSAILDEDELFTLNYTQEDLDYNNYSTVDEMIEHVHITSAINNDDIISITVH